MWMEQWQMDLRRWISINTSQHVHAAIVLGASSYTNLQQVPPYISRSNRKGVKSMYVCACKDKGDFELLLAQTLYIPHHRSIVDSALCILQSTLDGLIQTVQVINISLKTQGCLFRLAKKTHLSSFGQP